MQVGAAVRRSVSALAVLAILLLVPAGLTPGGTWVWPRAWVFLAVFGFVTVASTVALALWRPESFAVRQNPLIAGKDKKQPLIDAVGLPLYILYLAGWAAFIPLDVFTFKLLPPVPPLLSALGAAACLAGVTIGQTAVAQNRFAAPTIHDQSAEQQKVIDTGLYGLVRHPLYAGNLLTFSGVALWLGSYAALIGVTVMLAATLWRIGLEEAYLRQALPEYAGYARKVRFRLAPYLI